MRRLYGSILVGMLACTTPKRMEPLAEECRGKQPQECSDAYARHGFETFPSTLQTPIISSLLRGDAAEAKRNYDRARAHVVENDIATITVIGAQR